MLWKLLLDRLTVAKLLAGSVLAGAGNRAVVAPTGSVALWTFPIRTVAVA